ncbi:hypothetical protein Tco_1486838, partial [Tanacetum coccineum]
LNVDEMNYASWTYFFKNLYQGHELMKHVLGESTDATSSSDLSTDAYFHKIESIATILASLGSPISKDDIVNISLDGSPDNYAHVSDIIIHREPFPDLKTVRSMLATAEMRLKSKAQATSIDSSSSSPMVLIANSGNNNARHSIGTSGTNNGTAQPAQQLVLGSGQNSGAIGQLGVNPASHETLLSNVFSPMTLQDPTFGSWNMDTCASSHLNDSISSLSNVFNLCIYPSVSVGDGYLIHVTNSGHSILPTVHRPLHLNNNFLNRRVLLRCDSTEDPYPVTKPSFIPSAFLISQNTWHQSLGHPGSEVLRRVLSSN